MFYASAFMHFKEVYRQIPMKTKTNKSFYIFILYIFAKNTVHLRIVCLLISKWEEKKGLANIWPPFLLQPPVTEAREGGWVAKRRKSGRIIKTDSTFPSATNEIGHQILQMFSRKAEKEFSFEKFFKLFLVFFKNCYIY